MTDETDPELDAPNDTPPADVPPERAAAALRDAARARILARVGEPDLADHRVIL